MENNHLIDLTEQNAHQVLESSRNAPVLFYFWANMSPESLDMKPLVEKLAAQHASHLTVAMVDCEQQQMLAAQFGIRALPTMALFDNGKPVDGLMGPQSEDAVLEFLDKYLPNQAELAFKEALEKMDQGEYSEALTILKTLEADLGESGEYKLTLAECLIETKQFDLADATLATVLMQDQDARYKSLTAKIELYRQSADSPEVRKLQEAYDADPENDDLAFDLAVQLNQVDKHEEALELLMKLIRKDLNFADGQAKKTMMDILSSLGQGNEIASKFRRQLYALLY
ncbi:co-chaperone YbbN [Veronia nyctiphanis]|uniref:Co-chaperone YbbN n=1 Tax=Veronia nyctiphanis TaxID=1278244 RepID=A0A4Q0YXF4_9GAMM|nr:co-chaperone YbbN [Veronia nyctiphanis]RXJ73879.1 co-chaperone YbbN [Veronia nyctiphanis]